MKKIYFIILFIFAIFLRIYNIQYTSRFTRDESSNLVSIKNIYQNKKITLIGTMDESGIEVFSSFFLYLLLPFCVLFGFDPMSSVYGAVFYGISTYIFIALILKKVHWSYPLFILSMVFTPLLISSRWAWSPHLIPFLQALSLLILFSNLPYKYIFIGILMGLTIHLHWYAVFTTLSIIPIILLLDKKIKTFWQYSFGVFFTILPFILFDITHPPGLFITRMLYFSQPFIKLNHAPFLLNLWQLTVGLFKYFSGNQIVFGYITLTFTLLITIFHRTKNNFWLLPVAFQIIILSLIRALYNDHYIMPTAIFYLFWLFKNQNHWSVKSLIYLLIIFNFLNIPNILNSSDWSHNIQAQKQITDYISKNQKDNSSYNLIVLGSPDGNTKGLRFKDLQKIKNTSPKNIEDYQNINTLYVISYQKDWTKLSQDPAYEIDNFRNLKPSDIVKIKNSDWFVYKISRTLN